MCHFLTLRSLPSAPDILVQSHSALLLLMLKLFFYWTLEQICTAITYPTEIASTGDQTTSTTRQELYRMLRCSGATVLSRETKMGESTTSKRKLATRGKSELAERIVESPMGRRRQAVAMAERAAAWATRALEENLRPQGIVDQQGCVTPRPDSFKQRNVQEMWRSKRDVEAMSHRQIFNERDIKTPRSVRRMGATVGRMRIQVHCGSATSSHRRNNSRFGQRVEATKQSTRKSRS